MDFVRGFNQSRGLLLIHAVCLQTALHWSLRNEILFLILVYFLAQGGENGGRFFQGGNWWAFRGEIGYCYFPPSRWGNCKPFVQSPYNFPTLLERWGNCRAIPKTPYNFPTSWTKLRNCRAFLYNFPTRWGHSRASRVLPNYFPTFQLAPSYSGLIRLI